MYCNIIIEFCQQKRLHGALWCGASEETFDSRYEVRELANKKGYLEPCRCGASEETLTLDLFLGKEAL